MLKSSVRRLIRLAAYLLVAAWLAFVAMVMGLRYWVLPHIGDYREDIAVSISKGAGQRVTIGEIGAGWHALRPYLLLRDVTVHDRQGRPALMLGRVETTLSWLTVAVGDLRLHTLELSNPNLAVRRDAAGHFFVGGVEVGKSDEEPGFADWLLAQKRIIVRDATISWNDDLRGAPPLMLNSFNFRLENSGSHHRFGLRAVPPEGLAGPLDIRGDLLGRKADELLDWRGGLYAALDKTDLAGWGKWFDLPFDLQRGYGQVTLWLNADKQGVADVTAEVALSDIDARLAPDLPRLQLQTIGGRLGGRYLAPGFEFRARKLAFTAADGAAFPPADVFAHYSAEKGGKPESGELRISGLNLGALAALAAHLPFSPEQRALLASAQPVGVFSDLGVKWEGDWQAPKNFSAKGRFENLGVQSFSLVEGGTKIPGFANFSGNFDASEKGGTLNLKGKGAQLDFAGLFTAPLGFDNLTAQASWQARGTGMDFRLSSAEFNNADLAGNAYGSYRYLPGTPGEIDLTGHLNRADGRQVSRYLPLVVGADARDWVAHAVYGGASRDVRLRLKGHLADFPFSDGKKGIFEVVAKITGGTLEYAPGWPKLENIGADLIFRGARMDVLSQAANTWGMKIGKVRVSIPDLLAPGGEILEIDGNAAGPTADMLRFVEQSPVAGMIDNFTDGMRATGNGILQLKIKIPLRNSRDTQVAGSWQFSNNRVAVIEELPMLEQVNGKVDFTDTSVRFPGLTFQALGGGVTLAGGSQKDGSVRLDLRGRAGAAGIAKLLDHPLAQQLSGAADWQGLILVRKKNADFSVESNLLGLASGLPPPFAKKTTEVVPFRLERRLNAPRGDTWTVAYGKLLGAQFQRRTENGSSRIERGVVNLGAATAQPVQNGVWLNADLPYLDLDAWRDLLRRQEGGSGPGVAGINLKCEQLDVFGKRFNAVKIAAQSSGENWKSAVQSREMAGEVNWKPEGRGRVEARMKYLTVPESLPESGDSVAQHVPESNLPALDVVVDNLQIKRNKLGRLELKAVNESDDWRIESLKLANPDATLAMDGVWQAWRRKPTTRVNVHLDVHDVGKFLARLGYPDALRSGTAKLDGQLFWQGSPQDIDYPSLSGNLRLEAHNGQFAKIEPGIGKLLGILSLQALPRRITLDFRDVFSEGLAFDEITGTLKTRRGVMSSDDFRIEGPAARIAMKGETDLAAETQNIRVRVVPAIGSSVSLAGALLASPVIGVTALLVQKLLKDPLDQIAAYEYTVLGTWDNPLVEKIAPHVEPNETPLP
ncbi:MAG: TIGR02099 family protein [Sulfuricella sp.]|nr:TIGR02099 family protein [Sulfuricella sp.]